MRPKSDDEVSLDDVKHALKDLNRAIVRIRQAIEALPPEERDTAGGVRSVTLAREGGNARGTEYVVSKKFLAQLVLDGVSETQGMNPGKHVGDLIARASLASKINQR